MGSDPDPDLFFADFVNNFSYKTLQFSTYYIYIYFFFRWESLLVENRLKIIVIVREQGEGILQSSFSVGKGTICFRASLPLLLL